jgi:hypothetical protein
VERARKAAGMSRHGWLSEEVAMTSLELRFSGLRGDAAGLPDHDLLIGVVATQFDAVVDGERLYSQADFPVLELAQRLHGWICAGPPAGSELALGGGARVHAASSPGRRSAVAPGSPCADLTPAELGTAFRRFVNALDRDAGIDVVALLVRMAVRAAQPKIGPACG